MKLTEELIQNEFIRNVTVNNEEVLILTTPCKFKLSRKEVKQLKENYLDNEEIGGVLQARPTIVNEERIYVIEDIIIIRNAVEDKPILQGGKILKKSGAYLPDETEFNTQRNKIFEERCLPIFFHTHPTKGTNIFSGIINQQTQTDTSDPDRKESKRYDIIDGKKILMPRGLIVGNKDLGNDIFLGLYDGFIAPVGFEESKKKITNENLSKAGGSISESISNLNLSDKEKLIYGIGALLLIGGIIYKTKKFSIPVLLGLTVVGSSLLTNTTYVEEPNYYNRLSFGDIEIYIPKEEDDYLPNEQ